MSSFVLSTWPEAFDIFWGGYNMEYYSHLFQEAWYNSESTLDKNCGIPQQAQYGHTHHTW